MFPDLYFLSVCVALSLGPTVVLRQRCAVIHILISPISQHKPLCSVCSLYVSYNTVLLISVLQIEYLFSIQEENTRVHVHGFIIYARVSDHSG